MKKTTMLRKILSEKKLLVSGLNTEVLPVEEEEPEMFFEELAGRLKKEQIMEMICTLPAGYRTVFNLYVFESWSHREIAAELRCTESTSKSQLSKARAMLRKQLTLVLNKQIVA